jgi:hypothetical protein
MVSSTPVSFFFFFSFFLVPFSFFLILSTNPDTILCIVIWSKRAAAGNYGITEQNLVRSVMEMYR